MPAEVGGQFARVRHPVPAGDYRLVAVVPFGGAAGPARAIARDGAGRADLVGRARDALALAKFDGERAVLDWPFGKQGAVTTRFGRARPARRSPSRCRGGMQLVV